MFLMGRDTTRRSEWPYLRKLRMIRKYGSIPETKKDKNQSALTGIELKEYSPEKIRRDAKRILQKYIEDGLTPVTVRQLFYLMVSDRKLEKTENHYGRLGRAIAKTRRSNRLITKETDGITGGEWGWDCIRDEKYDSGLGIFGSIDATDQHIKQRAEQLQKQQFLEKCNRNQPLVWCESAGLVPQISKYANRLGAPVYSSGGFDSLTSKRHVGCKLWKGKSNTLVILHVGDKDRAGDKIFESLKGDVEAFANECLCKVRVQRIAVTAEQIKDLNLKSYSESLKTKSADGFAVKVEALPPSELMSIVEIAIKNVIEQEDVNKLDEI